MCTFNGAHYLQEQLDSIAAQTVLPDELVICDDGSNDETSEIIKTFAQSAPFSVRFIANEKNLGSTKNFEQAIRLCKGEFIALSDQDDWWKPEKIETLVAAFQDELTGGVFSDGDLMDGSSKLVGGSLWEVNRFWNTSAAFDSREAAVTTLLQRNVVTGATLMFRSSLRDELMPFPEQWVHDGWIAWMIVLYSRLVPVPTPLIHYRVHQTQQVGVPGRSAWARLKRSSQTGSQDYRKLDDQFSVLLQYAESHRVELGLGLCDRFEAKRRHLQFRAKLPAKRLERWVKIAGQVTAYRLYAQGWQSMIKDALV
jgi:glycosyltransferase involved in cell wall biosynthesis